MTATVLVSSFIHFGTRIDIPIALAGHETPADFANYWKTVRQQMDEVKDSHPNLDMEIKDPYAVFKKLMLSNNGLPRRYKGMYLRWTQYNPQAESDCYTIWFLRQWSSFLGKDTFEGLFGL